MSILAELPAFCKGVEHVWAALQFETTSAGFHARLELFRRAALRATGDGSGLTLSKLEAMVDALRAGAMFSIRPAAPDRLLPDVFQFNEELAVDSGEAYVWKWLVLAIQWHSTADQIRHPEFPLPIACLSGAPIDGCRHLLSLTALWHLF